MSSPAVHRDVRSTALLVVLLLFACSGVPEPPFAVAITGSESGLVTLTAQRGSRPGFVIRNAEVRVQIDGAMRSTRGATCVTSASVPLSCGLGDGLELKLSSAKEANGLLLTAHLTSTKAHVVGGFELLATKGSDSALELPKSTGRLRYLHNGYQSWSFAGVLDLPPRLSLPRKNDALVYAAPDGVTAFDEHLGLSSYDAMIDGGDGTALLLGFVSVRSWQGAIALESDSPRFSLTALNGFTGDTLEVGPSTPVDSEDLFVCAGTPENAMTAYGTAIDRRRDHSRDSVPLTQTGWFSWNTFFDDIDEPTVKANAAALAKLLPGAHLVEIDDGWENDWGDWTPNAKFPDFAALPHDLAAAHQTVGLWVAPFVVDSSLPVAKEHPDWFVRTPAGAPLVHQPFGTGRSLYVIDTTNKDALAWAVGNLTRLHDAGFDFFKLDYLYAAALDGKRLDPRATGVSALRIGLDAIFEALPTTPVNLCGVPWLHAALAPNSTIRIGSDVAVRSGNVTLQGIVFVAQAARNLAARAFGPLSKRSDVDQIPLAGLTGDEESTALSLEALTGGAFALGDDLTKLTGAEQALVGKAWNAASASADITPRDIFAQAGETLLGAPIEEQLENPHHVQSVLPSTIESQTSKTELVLVTNWGDEPADLAVPSFPSSATVVEGGPAPKDGHVHLASHASTLLRIDTSAD